MHSYTTPAILVLPIENVDPDYHAWLVAETEAAKVELALVPAKAGIQEAIAKIMDPRFRGEERLGAASDLISDLIRHRAVDRRLERGVFAAVACRRCS